MSTAELELEALAARLRACVAQGRYQQAQSALEEYGRALRNTAACLRPGDPRRPRLERESLRLIGETRLRVLAGRAHAGARLARLAQAPKLSRPYGEVPAPRRTTEWLA
jgi:hypothetical protein